MKNIYLLFLLVIINGQIGHSQNYTWSWNEQFTSNPEFGQGDVISTRIITKPQGVYVLGYYTGDLEIEDMVIETPNEAYRQFVAHFTYEGELINLATVAEDIWYSQIEIDEEGNIYLGGILYESETIGDININLEDGAAYCLKLSPDLELLSIQQIRLAISPIWGGQGSEMESIVFDKFGNKYIIINTVGPLTLGEETFPLTPERKRFLIKYNAADEYEWVEVIEGSDFLAIKLRIDQKGDLFLGGGFYNTLSLGGTTIDADPALSSQIFISKITSDGDVLWLKSFGTTRIDALVDLEIDERGDIFFAGNLGEGKATFEGIEIESFATNPYIVKMNSQGDVLMAKVEQTTNYFLVSDLTISNNSIVIVGSYYYEAYYPANGGVYLPHVDGRETFLAIYDRYGNYRDLIKVYGEKNDHVVEAKAVGDQLLLWGTFQDRVVLGNDILSAYINGGGIFDNNAFLASIQLDPYIGYLNKFNEEVLLYPNPSQGVFHLDFRNLNLPDNTTYKMEVFDMTGKRVAYDETNLQAHTISLPRLPIGIYNVIIQADDETFIRRILIKDVP